jgi:hypothetical protein
VDQQIMAAGPVAGVTHSKADPHVKASMQRPACTGPAGAS